MRSLFLFTAIFVSSLTLSAAESTAVCSRSEIIKKAIERILDKDCNAVTSADLELIKSINIHSDMEWLPQDKTLKEGDFKGLTNLEAFRVYLFGSTFSASNTPEENYSYLLPEQKPQNGFVLPQNLLQDVPKLKTFKLEILNSKSVIIPDDFFSNTKLKEITLHRALLGEHSFRNADLTDVQNVDFYGVEGSSVIRTLESFVSATNIFVYCENSKIGYIPKLSRKVQRLKVNNCGITDVSNKDILRYKNAVRIDLESNAISSIPSDLLKDMNKLSIISFYFNKLPITEITFSAESPKMEFGRSFDCSKVRPQDHGCQRIVINNEYVMDLSTPEDTQTYFGMYDRINYRSSKFMVPMFRKGDAGKPSMYPHWRVIVTSDGIER